MAISKQRIENRLRPFLLTRIPAEVLDMLVTEDYLDIFNDVAEDMNNIAALNVERFYKTGSSDISEDTGITNFLLEGIVERHIMLKYTHSTYDTQFYSYQNDRLVFKSSANGAVIDFYYVRKPERVSIDGDEIDLPSQVEQDYYEAVKSRFLSEYAENANVSYEEVLNYYADKALRKINRPTLEGVQRSWMGMSGDDTVYDITDHYISLENFATDTNGDLYYTGGNDGA